MTKNIKYILSALLALPLVLSTSSCSKQEIPSWGSTDYARIVGPSNWTLDTDSMEYSFASLPTTNKEFVVQAKVYVEGLNSSTDRTVYISTDKETTATADSYNMPSSVVIPAGKGYAELPITLYRTEAIQKVKYILKVSIDDSKSDIKTGVSAWHSFTIKFSDILAKPKNWSDLEEFFGASYSRDKYQFIINTLGFGDFTYLEPNGMSWGQMWNYRLIVVDALRRENAKHPDSPLTDENGSIISFDN